MNQKQWKTTRGVKTSELSWHPKTASISATMLRKFY